MPAKLIPHVTPEVSVCIPVFNEEENIQPMYEAVTDALRPMNRRYEIVFVDDGSSDDTLPRLKALSAADPAVVVVEFQRNYGQTAAMAAGIEHARGRYVVTMDGDLQNDPADIPMMLSKLEEGYDIVVGWRMNRQDKLFSRKVPSVIANRLIGKVTGLPIRDNGCSLKVYRASIIKRVPLYSDMHRFIPAMTIPMGARVAEVGVRHHARRFGESKYGLSRIFKVLLDLISIKTILIFARNPLGSFLRSAAAAFLLAILVAFLWKPGPNGVIVVEVAIIGLLISLSAFLLLLGIAVSTIFSEATRDEGDLASDFRPIE